MAILATPFHDPERGYERIEIRADGTVYGERSYRVNSHDPVLAIVAPGVPRIGEPWSEVERSLKCEHIATEYLGGGDASPQEGGGHTIIRAQYSTRPITILPYEPGQAFTELSTQEASVTIYATLDGRSIAAGRGTTKETGFLEAVVYVVRDVGANGAGIDWAAIVAAMDKPINQSQITLPPLLGSETNITIPAGFARFKGATTPTPLPGNRLRIGYRLALAPDHLERWSEEDFEGNAVGSVQTGAIYEASDYSGLWA